MPYTMTHTANNMAIAEQQHCTSHMVKLTHIDSCLGIIARKGQLLTAAHLVLIGSDGTSADVAQVASVFDDLTGYDEIHFVGQLSGWSGFIMAFTQFKANWFSDADPDADFQYGREFQGLIGARIGNKARLDLPQSIVLHYYA